MENAAENETTRLGGVLLDVDGTLIDSNGAHVHAWLDVLREHGFEITPDEIWPLIGMGTDNLLPRVTGLGADSERGKKIAERRGEILKERYLPHLRPFPGTRDLLTRMRDSGLKLIAASSSKKDEVEKLLELAEIGDILTERTSASDVESSKPAPDIVQVALDRIGLPADEVLMLGDTPYDIEAAGKCGIRVIAFRCGGFQDRDLRGALAIYDGPADLLARYESSPLGVAAPVPTEA